MNKINKVEEALNILMPDRTKAVLLITCQLISWQTIYAHQFNFAVNNSYNSSTE